MKKQTIAIDIDDVLAALAPKVVEYSNQKWGTNLTIEDYDEHWARMWQVDEEELLKRRDAMFSQYPYLDHYREALAVLRRLKETYRLVIVTSRLKKVHGVTTEWLNTNFPGVFSDIHYSGVWENLSLHSDVRDKFTKKEVLQQIGADYLIDDYPKHCIAAAEAGITSILFGDYAWNRHTQLRPNMVRAKTWQEVLEYFDDQG